MNRSGLRGVLHALPVLGVVLAIAGTRPALATPYVDITGYWTAYDFSLAPGPGGSALPAGLAISCFGGAATTGTTGCTNSVTLDQTVAASENLSISVVSGVAITNTTGQAYDGTLLFQTDFSDFEPVGSLGVGVDDLITQSASFSSSVSGLGVGSSHNCSMGTGPAEGCILYSDDPIGGAAYREGVWSPDSSQELAGIPLDLAPGASVQIPYLITIGADFQVPEPSTLVILGSALLFFGLIRRRRSSIPRVE